MSVLTSSGETKHTQDCGNPQARQAAHASNSSTEGWELEGQECKVSVGYRRPGHKHPNHHVPQAVV